MPDSLWILAPLIFLVAVLYSSVGHGGASGYLAVLSFFAFPPDEMATTALMLNLAVAGLALYRYRQAGYFSWQLTWPFLIASIPLAFVGGLVTIPQYTYFFALGLVLVYAAWQMATGSSREPDDAAGTTLPPWVITLPTAAGIGFVSGVTGVGGGIFLSPVIILCGWADPKRTAATSACFIWLNSLAGLGGRYFRQDLEVGNIMPLLLAGVAGSLLGAFAGTKSPNLILRRILAVVLLIAALKMLF
jgi:uncharacterized protein